MNYIVQIIVIIILLFVVLYLVKKSEIEGFTADMKSGYKPGNPLKDLPGEGLRHPEGDLVYATIDSRERNPDWTWQQDLDPETIRKLKDTILTDVSRTSKTEVAYNQLGAYRPDRIRPFNDTNSRLSHAEADNFRFINDSFDNSFSVFQIDQ